MPMRVVAADRPVGAEITGVDLGDGVTDDGFETIRAALNEFGVVFFRDQRISRRGQIEISQRLGPLRPPPPETDLLAPGYPDLLRMSNIRENGKPIGHFDAGGCWHTDQCYRDVPNGYAVMYAIEVPRSDDGTALGQTMFVNMRHAYDTLPEVVKDKIKPLRAVQSMYNRYWKQVDLSSRRDVQDSHYLNMGSATHPVVRAHPITGAPCLYVNERYTETIEGWGEDDSRTLLTELFQHSTREETRYSHNWRAGDLLIWDDCMVLHHAVLNYPMSQRRLIERTLVESPRPIPAFPTVAAQAAQA